MASTYVPDPDSVKSPAIRPQPDAVQPVLSLPADGDALNAASVAQAFEAAADWISWLMAPRAFQQALGSWTQPIRTYMASGNYKRSIIDHQGFPAGKFIQVDEDWANTTGDLNAPQTNAARGERHFVSAASFSATDSSVLGDLFDSVLKTNTVHVRAGIIGGDYADIRRGAVTVCPNRLSVTAIEFDLKQVTAGTCVGKGMQLSAGLTNASSTAVVWTGDVGGPAFIGFVRRNVEDDTNWQCAVKKNSGTATVVDSGIAIEGSSRHRFRIEVIGKTVDDEGTTGGSNVGRALFYIDGAKVAEITTDVDNIATAAGTNMALDFNAYRAVDDAAQCSLVVGPYRIRHSHWNSVTI